MGSSGGTAHFMRHNVFCAYGLIELRAGRDVRIDHQQVKLFFAVFLVHGGDEHAAGVDAHHRARRQVGDGDARLADQLFRLIVHMNTGEDRAVNAGAVVKRELEQLLALLHGAAVLDLYGTEIRLGECFKIHIVGKERLDDDVGEVNDLLSRCGLGRRRLAALRLRAGIAGGSGLGLFALLIRTFKRGDFRDQT